MKPARWQTKNRGKLNRPTQTYATAVVTSCSTAFSGSLFENLGVVFIELHKNFIMLINGRTSSQNAIARYVICTVALISLAGCGPAIQALKESDDKGWRVSGDWIVGEDQKCTQKNETHPSKHITWLGKCDNGRIDGPGILYWPGGQRYEKVSDPQNVGIDTWSSIQTAGSLNDYKRFISRYQNGISRFSKQAEQRLAAIEAIKRSITIKPNNKNAKVIQNSADLFSVAAGSITEKKFELVVSASLDPGQFGFSKIEVPLVAFVNAQYNEEQLIFSSTRDVRKEKTTMLVFTKNSQKPRKLIDFELVASVKSGAFGATGYSATIKKVSFGYEANGKFVFHE